MQLKPCSLLGLLGMSAVAWAGDLTLTTAQGETISGVEWGSGSRGVLLLHDDGRTAQDWASFGPTLAAAGFHALALDTQSPTPDAVTAGIAWLRGRGATELHLVGAGAGGLLAAATPGDVDLVVLSPPLRAGALTLSTAAKTVSDRPILIVSTESDVASARAAQHLATHATGPHHVQLYDSGSTGARLLNAVPSVEPLILSWLRGTHPAIGTGVTVTGGPSVQSGEVTDIRAQGRRFEDR